MTAAGRLSPGDDAPFTGLFRAASAVLFACAGLAMLIHNTPAVLQPFTELARYFAARQDMPVAAAAILFYVQFASRARAVGLVPLAALSSRQALGLLVLIALAAWALRTQLLLNYDLSRDEQMATFDARIFAHGQIYAPLSPFWRDWYDALNPTFILPVGDREGLVFSYLPVNAAWRALISLVLPTSIASPLLVLIGGLALWRIAARLWPDSGSTSSAVLLLYAGSSQVIVMGATTYAANFEGRLAYHEFEGVTVRAEEGARLLANLGDKQVLMLRNHGPVVLAPTIPAMFVTMWTLQRACEVQVATLAMGPPRRVSPEAIAQNHRDMAEMQQPGRLGEFDFAAWVRRIDRTDRSWRD